MTTVPLIVEAIFRFIPSALVVYLFIDVNLTSRFNKYIQWTCVSLLYMAAGLIGQYLREAYNIQVVDFSLALILVTCYSLFFHTDSVGFRIFIGSFSFLSQILVDTVFAAIIFVCFPDFNYEIGHLSYPALLAADIEMLIYGIFLFAATMVIKRVRLKTGINKKALVFMLFPLSQVLILCVIIKLIMANSENATAEITYFTLACVVICVISDILCYRGLIQNSQLYETKMRNEQLEYGLKDGKPIEKTTAKGKKTKKGVDDDDEDEDDFGDLPPAVTKLLKAQQKQIEALTDTVGKVATTMATSTKQSSAKGLFESSKLPAKWFSRIDVNSETSVEDQIKDLQEEYAEIKQSVIDDEIAGGDYKPNSYKPKERSEKEWLDLMEDEESDNNGVASLGLED